MRNNTDTPSKTDICELTEALLDVEAGDEITVTYAKRTGGSFTLNGTVRAVKTRVGPGYHSIETQTIGGDRYRVETTPSGAAVWTNYPNPDNDQRLGEVTHVLPKGSTSERLLEVRDLLDALCDQEDDESVRQEIEAAYKATARACEYSTRRDF